ncbi:MAG: 23S rRNA (guanosine(2251)-2'-O)-methyltransferase RlmB [Burkholderiales bacterium]|jgi:23S rRNA (guanosine2251-2'-O)-methyltransferase|nr:MAG: 23S rRNA (guanosine(2251)-2'-O)-methyltransferase RlmB [Burkholderiales bacterium]
MLIYGFHAVLARLRRAPAGVRELYVDARREDVRVRDLLRVAEAAGVRAHFVDADRLERLCPHKRHQGVVALVEAPPKGQRLDELLDAHESAAEPILLLVLDGVTDPRNLGACLRVADGAGAAAVIAPKDRACALTEIAMQTASGAAESVPYLMVTNLARALDEIRDRGIFVVGTDERATTGLYEQRLEGSLAWVLGAEGTGMRRLTRERCDALVRIPMRGAVGSLNVSVAAGVVLYETLRQRAAVAAT